MQHEHIPRFLTIEQVAEELNVGLPQIRALLKSGELRGIQVGGKNLWRIGRIDVENYIEAAYEQTARRIATGEVNHLPDLGAP
ncbi:excisionase family DNA-binding protein [Arthrobacter sp. UYEF36]|uniref:excisionase family DNA-binding protein n=1 Tax=Arthrobacter sp. UYEF36 TaxID=1756366 RepID=UPI0033990925